MRHTTPFDRRKRSDVVAYVFKSAGVYTQLNLLLRVFLYVCVLPIEKKEEILYTFKFSNIIYKYRWIMDARCN